jgi:Na+-driven multidrug efflux pump
MQKYLTIRDFNESVGAIPVIESVVTSVPPFFPVMLFFIWILGTASSYFSILKTTGKKRFWHSLAAMSFASFILSLVITSINSTMVILHGYWVGFYILMTLASWFMLVHYK